MARDEPSAPPHDRRHDGPQSVAGDAAILPLCGGEVQPLFWSLARTDWAWRRCVPSRSIWSRRRFVASTEPDRLRAAVLLRRDARPAETCRSASPMPREPQQAAGRAERR